MSKDMCKPSHGEIAHTSTISKGITALYLNDNYTDVTLKVGNESFKAHKVILAARSQYFRALLYGGLKESTQTEISLPVSNAVAFKSLLKYIYTGRLSLSAAVEEETLDILGLAHQFGFQNLKKAICDFYAKSLSAENVFFFHEIARFYQLDNLTETCRSYIDKLTPSDIVSHVPGFLQISSKILKDIVKRDSFYAPELEIFKMIQAWAFFNNIKGSKILEEILNAVRFELMTKEELCTVVSSSGLVKSKTILDALQQQAMKKTPFRYRGILDANVNIAHPGYGAQVIRGEMKSALFDPEICFKYYLGTKDCTRHSISDVEDSIIIQLGHPSIINHIKIHLYDKTFRSYSYYIEVSADKENWTVVVDHTNNYCRSWQKLFFEPRVVNYIKIVGTHSTADSDFHIMEFEAMYSTKPFNLVDGILRPVNCNVATTKHGASVIDVVPNQFRNYLLGGNLLYDLKDGCTSHRIGSDAISVQLGQPYMVDSMSILLWDIDHHRSYGYYVEVSTNNKTWDIVWDKRNDNCKSWQFITFPLRPVNFIRITGTKCNADDVLRLVHLECPSTLCTEDNIKKNLKRKDLIDMETLFEN